MMHRIAVLVLLALAPVAAWVPPAAGQDRVTFRPSEEARPVMMVGQVLDYTGRQLTLQPTGTARRIIPADHVEGIETNYDPAHLRGQALFRQGKIGEAAAAFQEALRRDKREWVRRELLAWIVRCEMRERDLLGAITTFRELVKTDPDTRHWGIAPLAWAPMSISSSVKGEARHLLVGSLPSDRLLGASLLLLDATDGDAAERELRELSRNSNPRISGMGKCQLWRLELASRDVSEVALLRWAADVQHLPPQLRGGPQYLLARGYEVRGEFPKAAAEYMWIPLVYSENEQLAARATLEAAEASGRTGLTREADALYRELLFRFPWSREAATARTRIREDINDAGAGGPGETE